MMLGSDAYTPAFILRNGYVQTFLASSPVRAWGNNPMCAASREMILETADGVRLLGFYSAQATGRSKGMIVLLHGWEGSADSTYIRCTGKALYRRGYDIFRLNFRDHGPSHHLNTGLFYAVLLDEVFQAVRQASRLAAAKPLFLVGYSLGANFALRIVRNTLKSKIDNLRHVVAISPVLDPQKATARIDNSQLIRRYFLRKWRRSLKIKQQLFPDVYDFAEVLALESIQAVTDRLLEKYSDFNSAREYFKAYSILNGAIKNLPTATTIITAKDDPIIPVEDFYRLELNDRTRLVVHAFGGHNGFLDGLSLKSRYEHRLPEFFDEIVLEEV